MSPRSSAAETEITRLIMDRTWIIHDKNMEALIAHSDSAVQAYDVMAPLEWSGLEPLREKLTGWFTGYDGPIGYDIRDLEVTATDNIGFAHYVYNVTGTLKDGSEVDMWVRARSASSAKAASGASRTSTPPCLTIPRAAWR